MVEKQNWWSNTKFLLVLNTVILFSLFFKVAPVNDWLVIGFILLLVIELSLLFGLFLKQGKLSFWLRIVLPILFGSYLFYVWVSSF